MVFPLLTQMYRHKLTKIILDIVPYCFTPGYKILYLTLSVLTIP